MFELPGMLNELLQDHAVLFQFLAVLFSRMIDGFRDFDISLTELRQYVASLEGAPFTLVQFVTDEFFALKASLAEAPGEEAETKQVIKAYYLILMSLHGLSPEELLQAQDKGCKGRRLVYKRAWRMHRILSHKLDPLTRTIKETSVGDVLVLGLLNGLNMHEDQLKRREMYSQVLEPAAAFTATHSAYLDSIIYWPKLDNAVKVR